MRFSRRTGVLLLTTLACPAWAQTTTQPARVLTQTPRPHYDGSVTGHVYCADTNAPARFARVTLTPVRSSDDNERGFSQQSAATGLDGSYTIQSVKPGMYYVSASLPGYLSPLAQVSQKDLSSRDADAQQRVAKVLSPISVNGSSPTRNEIRLVRGAAISGTVTYDDGSPAANIQVTTRLANSTGASEHFDYFNGPPPRTDDYGRFRITGLASGDYVVFASTSTSASGFLGGLVNSQYSALTIYAPRNFRSVDAKTFNLRAGTEINGADIIVPLAAFHTVSGNVESNDGHTLNAGSLTLVDDKDKTHSFRATVHSDGTFQFFYVPEGNYILSLTGGAVTEAATTDHQRPKTVQSYANVSTSVLVQNGDLTGVTVKPVEAAKSDSATAATAALPQN